MKKILTATVLAVFVAGSSSASTLTDLFTSYYAFGDSLTDDGKFGALDPPSLGGRFSNGITYAEHIANEFIAAGRDTGNLALGGATAGDTNLSPAGPLSTFKGQVQTFQGALAGGFGLPEKLLPTPTFSPTPPAPGKNPLISVLFGANDIFQGFSPISAANSVAENIRTLASTAGFEFDDFLVAGLPDIGQSPAFAGAGSADATAATNAFNLQLALNIIDLETNDGLNIIGFDTDAVFQDVLADIRSGTFSYGIFDATNPCTVSIGAPLDPNFTNPGSCLDLGIDPNTLLFVDGVHPNGRMHEIFAGEILKQLNQSIAPIPLPATLPLLVVGLAGFGVLRRRRA